MIHRHIRTGPCALALTAWLLATGAVPKATHDDGQEPARSGHSEPAPGAAEPAPSAPAHDAPWGYEGDEGPVHWGHIAPDYALCSAGRMQSPVDLGQANVAAAFAVTVDYKRGPLNILNNGHTIQVNFPAGSTLVSSGKRYDLLQVHFHTPSENQVNGKSYPMEAHFVHRDTAGQLAVLAVFFQEGPTNNELAKIVVAAPGQPAGPNAIEGFSFDANQLLPADLKAYRLMGSLTTPPCTEGVNWHVAKATVTASATQIAAMHKLMHDNARPVQPLNNRLVLAPN
jgi:carbonic anhydrase